MRVDPKKLEAFQFSEEAQATARSLLTGEGDRSPEAFFALLKPLFEVKDMQSAFLVGQTFFKHGGSLADTCRFARNNRRAEEYGPMLDWIKTTLISGEGPDKLSKEEIDLYTEAARLWMEENQ